jgi:hypothetical protein
VIGLLVPVAVYPLWQSVNSGTDLELKIGFENFAMVVWPSSIMLMSLEGSGGRISAAIIMILSLVVDGVMYGCSVASGEHGDALRPAADGA